MSDLMQIQPGVPLRDYQKKAASSMVKNFIERGLKSGIVVLPTGSGKTVTCGTFNFEVYRRLGLKCIWVAHRDELIKQAAKAHQKIYPSYKISYWTATEKDCSGDIIFVSIQSARMLANTLEVNFGSQNLKYYAVIDEAHHFAEAKERYTNSYANLIKDLFDKGVIRFCVGLTATAGRLDGKRLGFDEIVYQMTFIEGVKEGFLARPQYYEIRTEQEFHIDKRKGDYTDKDLAKLDNEKRNAFIAQEFVNKKDIWGKTIMFALNVNHCYNLAEKIRLLDPDMPIKVVTGGTPDQEREELSAWLAEGPSDVPKVAINCLVFTEGFDEPTINTVFLTRPTLSETLWMQMVGRGARIVKDADGNITKRTFNLVNIMDNIGRYGALVKEWSLSVREDAEAVKAKKTNKNNIRAKRKLIRSIEDTENLSDIKLSEAQLIDVQAILIVGSKHSRAAGIPLDRDRMDCLRLLKEYVEKQCYKVTVVNNNKSLDLDFEAFKNSYSYCVQANEFNHATWREVIWGYYYHYIRGLKTIRNKETGKFETTWQIIPLVDTEEILGEEAVRASNDRTAEIKESAARKNEEFNLKYGSREGTTNLYQAILDGVAEAGYNAEALFVTQHIAKVIVRDRRVEIKLNVVIENKFDPNLKIIGALNKVGTAILQDMLDDSVAEFRASPRSQ